MSDAIVPNINATSSGLSWDHISYTTTAKALCVAISDVCTLSDYICFTASFELKNAIRSYQTIYMYQFDNKVASATSYSAKSYQFQMYWRFDTPSASSNAVTWILPFDDVGAVGADAISSNYFLDFKNRSSTILGSVGDIVFDFYGLKDPRL